MSNVYVIVRRGCVDGVYTDGKDELCAEIVDLDSDCREEKEQEELEQYAVNIENTLRII